MPTTQLPPRPLRESPGQERAIRVVLAVVAILAVLLSLGGIAGQSIAAGIERSSYEEVPAIHEAGLPEKLTVTTDVADVRVQVTDEVDQVTLALVEPGSSTLPADPSPVSARWVTAGDDASARVEVQRPSMDGPSQWLQDSGRDLLVAVPAEHAEELSLAVRTQVGEIEARGGFAALDLESTTGDIDAQDVSARGRLGATTQIGDLDLALADAGAKEVHARTATGDVSVEVPCCDTWQVDSQATSGTTDIDPAIRGAGPVLGLRTDVGDVTVSRR